MGRLHDIKTVSCSTILSLIIAGFGFIAHAADLSPTPLPETSVRDIKLSSTSFANEGDIPAQYTCDGENITPSLTWTRLPADAKSLVLIVDDADAKDSGSAKSSWVHWIAYNIPVTISNLETNLAANKPVGMLEGLNSWKKKGYSGPCPPSGKHRYRFKIYALDIELPELKNPDRGSIEKAMQEHIVGQAELVGKYQRQTKPAN